MPYKKLISTVEQQLDRMYKDFSSAYVKGVRVEPLTRYHRGYAYYIYQLAMDKCVSKGTDLYSAHIVAMEAVKQEGQLEDEYGYFNTPEEEKEMQLKLQQRAEEQAKFDRVAGFVLLTLTVGILIGFGGCIKATNDRNSLHNENVSLIDAMPDSEKRDKIIDECMKVNRHPRLCSDAIKKYK